MAQQDIQNDNKSHFYGLRVLRLLSVKQANKKKQ